MQVQIPRPQAFPFSPRRKEEILEAQEALTVLGCPPAGIRTHHPAAVQEHAAGRSDSGNAHARHATGSKGNRFFPMGRIGVLVGG